MGFEAHGKLFHLPVCLKESSPSELLEPTRLSYLAGFFDGDGCVSPRGLSGCCLQVVQSVVQPEILLLFRDMFGGSIVRGGDGLGLRRPILSWRICGSLARRAAHLLSPHSILKKRQLSLAAAWPDEQADRQAANVELRSLKQYDSAVVGPCSLEYFAGFFDAEGYVEQCSHSPASLRLWLRQKHSAVLHCLQGFLQSEFRINAPIRFHRSYVLIVSDTPTCKFLLGEMLQAGLICKAKQAETAIGLTLENCDDTRAALGTMVGNQRFGQRLDKAGVERASKIRRLQRRAGWLMQRGEVKEAEAILQETADLKEEHQLLNAQQENQELLQYIDRVQGLQENFWQVTDGGMFISRKCCELAFLRIAILCLAS